MLTALLLLLQIHAALIAENLFLRQQHAMFQERNARPRRAKPAERLALLALARFFNWPEVLAIVKVETFIGWYRTAFQAFWRWQSRSPGRPSLPKNLRELIGDMAAASPTWGKERIADELSLKLASAFRGGLSASTWTSCGPGAGAPRISGGPRL